MTFSLRSDTGTRGGPQKGDPVPIWKIVFD